MKWYLYLIKLLRIFCSNYISYEWITCDNKDLLWFNKHIKKLSEDGNNTYKSNILNDKNPLEKKIQKGKNFQNLQCSIEDNKWKFYLRTSKILMDPASGAKTSRSILQTLLNNTKIPCIIPRNNNYYYYSHYKF